MTAELVPSQADRDAAKRLHEAVTLALLADFHTAIRSVLVVNLQDGSCDGTLYSSWQAACDRGAPDPRWYAPLRITPDGINERDALVFLRTMRKLPGVSVLPTAPEHKVAPLLYLPGGRKLRP